MLFSSAPSVRPTKAHMTGLAAELLEGALALEAFQCRLQGQSTAPSVLRLEDMYQRTQKLHTGAHSLHLPMFCMLCVMAMTLPAEPTAAGTVKSCRSFSSGQQENTLLLSCR